MSESSTKRVLAIHAHPDDIEFQCAGTLLLLKESGWTIVMASLTPGDGGSAELGPEEIAAVRREEARRSARLLGAEYHCLEFRDLQICHDNPSRQRVTEFLRQVQPDVIITAPPLDYMADHEITSRLVRDAAFAAPVPNYWTNAPHPHPPTAKIPYLFYVDAVEGIDWYGNRQPTDFIVDVSTVFEQKQAALACHESQRSWLLRQHGIDEYLEAQSRWCQKRGAEAGFAFGEGFRQHTGHPYPHDPILVQALGATRVKPTK